MPSNLQKLTLIRLKLLHHNVLVGSEFKDLDIRECPHVTLNDKSNKNDNNKNDLSWPRNFKDKLDIMPGYMMNVQNLSLEWHKGEAPQFKWPNSLIKLKLHEHSDLGGYGLTELDCLCSLTHLRELELCGFEELVTVPMLPWLNNLSISQSTKAEWWHTWWDFLPSADHVRCGVVYFKIGNCSVQCYKIAQSFRRWLY